MKLIEVNAALRDLNLYIEQNIAKLNLHQKQKQSHLGKPNNLRKEPNTQQKEDAATAIQRMWRKRKIKQAIGRCNPKAIVI